MEIIEYINRNGVYFNTYKDKNLNLWVTDISVGDISYKYYNDYRYFEGYNNLTFNDLCILCNVDPNIISEQPVTQTNEELLRSLEGPFSTEEDLKLWVDKEFEETNILPTDIQEVKVVKNKGGRPKKKI